MICAIIVAVYILNNKALTIQGANPPSQYTNRIDILDGVNMGIWVRHYFFSLPALPLAFLTGFFFPLDWATSLFTIYDF